MKQKPVLSIAILTHNRVEAVLRALHSVNGQRFHPGNTFEIVVLDNGSADDTAIRIAHEFPDARLLQSPSNIGCPAGRNEIYAHCQGRIIVNLDDDGQLGPDLLVDVIDLFESDPRIGIVAFRREETVPDEPRCRNVQVVDTQIFSGGVSAFSKSMLDEIGHYPGNYFFLGEEEHLALRALNAGYRIVYANHILMLHAAQGGSSGARWDYLRVRNLMMNVVEIFPFPYNVIFFVYRAALYFFLSLRRGTLIQYMTAMAWIIQTMMVTARHPVSRTTIAKFVLYGGRTSRLKALIARVFDRS